MWIYLIFFLFSIIYIYFHRKYSYWEKKGFPSVRGIFPLGSMGLSESPTEFFLREYEKFKQTSPAFGIYFYNRKTLIPTDPKLIREILVKNFENFNDHGYNLNESSDALMSNIYTTSGQKWKDLRSRVDPAFSNANIKMMFPIISLMSNRLTDYMEKFIDKNVDIKEIFQQFTIEVITNVAYGIETKCLGNPQNEFYKIARGSSSASLIEIIKMFILMCSESLSKWLDLRYVPSQTTIFFCEALRKSVIYREKNEIIRNDFCQLMMNLMKNPKVQMPFSEMAANCYMFLHAGFDTISLTSTFLAYELALNIDIQERLRDEIFEILEKYDDEVNHESIAEMKYLDMVLNETLRKWPVTNLQYRKNSHDFPIPNSNLVIPAETFIIIPTLSIHRDERFYENPEKFDPERFNEENSTKRQSMTFIPFSEGPRKCLGMKFGIMQIKISIVKILRDYRLTTCSKTLNPMKFCSNSGELWLKLEEL